MANILIGWPIRSDDATLSGGLWEALLPLTNLQDRRLAKAARSASALVASTKFDADMTVPRHISAVALVRHNLSLSAQVRITGSAIADLSSPVYESGWVDAFPTAYPTGMPQWETTANQAGALTAEDWDDEYQTDFIHVLTTATTARYWRVEVSDTSNADGYVQIGRLAITSGYQPTINMAKGAGLGVQATTARVESPGGVAYFDVQPTRRLLNFTLPMADVDEALVHPFQLQRLAGTSQQMLVVFDPDDTTHLYRRSFLATLGNLSPLAIPYAAWHDIPLALIEEL